MIIWTDYMRYRARLRGFDLDEVKEIVRLSAERYTDEAPDGKSWSAGMAIRWC